MPKLQQAAAWLPFAANADGVLLGVSTRHGGISAAPYAANNMALHVGDEEASVLQNRRALQQQLGVTHVQWLQQVHGIECIEASLDTVASAPMADAAWTQTPGLALGIMTADCVPVLLWDHSARVVAAVHAGWRGLVAGVLESVLAAVAETVPVAQLNAWIGPCIGVQRYEVGQEVWQHFVNADFADAGAVVQPHPEPAAMAAGKRLLDLAKATQLRLRQAGVNQVFESGLCSYADERFYSYREAQQTHPGQDTGRMVSLIMLR